jgi:hypothetical protein
MGVRDRFGQQDVEFHAFEFRPDQRWEIGRVD